MAEEERAQWGSQVEFMMTMISYAVGIGNIWRFPYLTYANGGGAFLIPYATMLCLVGMPMFFMECALGQFCGLGPSKAWKISPLFRGLGWASWATTTMISMYYNVLVAYMLYYLVASMGTTLPWATCAQGNGTWASHLCVDVGHNLSQLPAQGVCANNGSGPFEKPHTPSEDYYYNYVAHITNGLEDVQEGNGPWIEWRLVIALAIAWFIVGLVLIRGVQSLGKIVYVTAIFPYIMLTIVLVNNCLQEGAWEGILFYVHPDWDKLLNYQIWADAASQIFFSLSVSWGGLIAMSSYNSFHNNIQRDTIIVCLINCGTSFYAGFAIFSALGTIAHAQGLDVSLVATKGPELALVTYPAALATMSVAPLWAILFYIMMALLGFGSQFSNIETVMTVLFDELPGLNRTRARSMAFRVTCFIFFFFMGLPMLTGSGLYLLNLIDQNAGAIPLLLIGMLEAVAISWVYGTNRFCQDIQVMIGFKPNFVWRLLWTYVTPILLTVLTVVKIMTTIQSPTDYEGYKYGKDCPYVYPTWGYAIAWMTIFTPVMCIVIGFLRTFLHKQRKHPDRGMWQVLRIASRPSKDWMSQVARREAKKPPVDQPEEVMMDGVLHKSLSQQTDLDRKSVSAKPTGGHDNHSYVTEKKEKY